MIEKTSCSKENFKHLQTSNAAANAESAHVKNHRQSDPFFENIKKSLIEVLEEETKAIQNLVKNFPNEASILVDKILKNNGRVVFAGMGKSGIIAKKIVATFSSLGITSLFIHPADALHGDLGMIQQTDFFIGLSKRHRHRTRTNITNIIITRK